MDEILGKFDFEGDPRKAIEIYEDFIDGHYAVFTEEECDLIEEKLRGYNLNEYPRPGYCIQVIWKRGGYVDTGYIHPVPWASMNDYPDFLYICHFPNAYQGEKEPRKSLWVFLGQLMLNNEVKHILLTRPTKPLPKHWPTC